MSYSNQTTHYGLPLPTASDRSVWTDNNTAFEAIDSAIYTASQNASGASEAVSAMATTVTGHTANISTLNAEVATLSTSVSGIESDVDALETSLTGTNGRVTALENLHEVVSATNTVTSLEANTYTNVAEITLTAGTWLLFGTIVFGSTTKGTMLFALDGVGGEEGGARSATPSATDIILSSARVLTITDSHAVNLRCSSGVATSIHGVVLKAVRYS